MIYNSCRRRPRWRRIWWWRWLQQRRWILKQGGGIFREMKETSSPHSTHTHHPVSILGCTVHPTLTHHPISTCLCKYLIMRLHHHLSVRSPHTNRNFASVCSLSIIYLLFCGVSDSFECKEKFLFDLWCTVH